MSSSNRDNGAEFRPNAHGGRNQHGTWNRMKNIHSKLSEPIDPDLEGIGVHVDIPDLEDRIRRGNQFSVGTEVKGPNAYMNDNENKMGLTLFKGNACPNKDIGIACEIGKVEGAIDGIGVRYNACGAASNFALGPVDIGGRLGTAEAGIKVWEPDVGLDAGFKANASAAELQVGIVNANVGVGIDTGVKAGKEGVGLQVLGTGFQIGRTTGVSLFGSSLSFKLW